MSFKNISVVLTGTDASLGTVLNRAGRQVDNFDKKVAASAISLGKWGAVARGSAVGLTAVAVGLAYATAQATKFDTQMRNVQSITKQTDASLRATGDELLNMSRRLPQTAETLAAGLYNVASSGFKGAEGLEVLENAAIAASAGLTTTDVAAKGITAVLNAYGRGAEDAADVSDVLFQTVNLGVITFEELASEIGDVVGTAAAAGVAIDDVGAAIAAMTLSGISGAESTTSLNRLIQSLIQPSDALRAKMDELGIGIEDLKDPAIGLRGVMEQLREESGGNVETLLSWFTEIRAARGAFALMAAGGKNYRDTTKGISDEQERAGATAAALKEQMKSLSAQGKVFVNWVNAGAIEVGSHLLPVVIDLLKELREFGSSVGPGVAAAWERIVPLLQTVWQIGVNVVDVIATMVDTVDDLAIVLGALGFGALTGALKLLADLLENVTGFFADNEGAAQALAIILGGILVASAGKASFALALLAKGQIAAGIGAIISQVRMMVGSFAALAAVSGPMSASLAAIGMAAAPLIGMLAIGIGVSAVNAMRNAEQAGREMGAAIRDSIKPGDIDSIRAGFNQMTSEIQEQNRVLAEQADLWGYVRGAIDLLPIIDMGDTVIDASGKLKGLAAEAGPVAEQLQAIRSVVTALQLNFDRFGGGAFGNLQTVKEATANVEEGMRSVAMWVNKLDLDPTTMSIEDMADAIDTAMTQAEIGSPAVDAMAEALKVMGDETSDATDKLDSFKEALDAVIGVHISAFEATTKLGSALQGIVTATVEGGHSLDQYTEAGQANRDALANAANAAIDHANAVARDVSATQGVEAGIRAGNQALNDNVIALTGVMQQSGYTEQQIAEMISIMGLTPENINTLIQLVGAEGVKVDLGVIRNLEDAVAEGAHGSITVDTSQAMTAIGELIRGLVLAGGMIDAAGLDQLGASMGAAPRIPSAPRLPSVPRISPGTGGGGGGGGRNEYLDALHRENEAIAKNTLQWELDNMAIDARIAKLDQLIAKERPFTDRWMDLQRQRQQAAEEQHQNLKDFFEEQWELAQAVEDFLEAHYQHRLELEDNAFDAGKTSTDEYLGLLRERLVGLEEFSNDWMQVWDRIQSIEKEAEQKRTENLDKLNDLLDREADIRQRMRDNVRQHNRELADLEQQYNDQQNQILDDRKQQLSDWADVSQRVRVQWGNTAAALTNNIRDQIDQFAEWAEALNQAREMGISEELIQLLGLDEGPEALGQLKTLTSATEAEIDALNQAVLDKAAQVGQQVGDEQTQTYSDVGEQLEDLAKQHQERLAEMQEEFLEQQEQLKDELEELGKEQGRTFAEAIAEGMKSGIQAIKDAAEDVQDAMQGGGSSSGGSSSGGSSSGGTNVVGPNDYIWVGGGLLPPGATYDSGGILPPGTTLAHNKTGQNEFVFTAAQLAAMQSRSAQAGAPMNVKVDVYVGNKPIRDEIKIVIRDDNTGAVIKGSH